MRSVQHALGKANYISLQRVHKRQFRSSAKKLKRTDLPDERLGHLIRDEYAKIRDTYGLISFCL